MIKKVVNIWGTGSAFESFHASYPNLNINVFIDNNKQRQNERFFNKLVISPADIKNYKEHVIIVSENFEDIGKQMVSMGYKYGSDFSNYEDYLLKDVDNLIISFPKCGRTWLRTIIGKILQQHYSLESEMVMKLTDAPIALSKKIPVILAYHDQHPHLKKADELVIDKNRYKNKNIVFMVRDPRDVLVSLYYHQKFRANISISDKDRYYREKIDTVIKYFNTWSSNSAIFNKYEVITYEQLHQNPIEEVTKVLKTFGLEKIPESVVLEAIEFSTFDKMRTYEQSNSFKHHTLRSVNEENKSMKVRKGQIGGYVDEMTADQIYYINTKLAKELNHELKTILALNL